MLSCTELIERAIEAERRGRFGEAKEALRRAVAVGDGPAQLDASLRLGWLLVSGGAPNEAEAEEVLRQARQAAERAGSSAQAASAIHMLALLSRNRGQLDAAEKLLAQSPMSDPHARPSAALAQWYHYRGLIQAEQGDLNRAERLYFQGYQVYQESGHEPGLAQLCDSLANLLLRRGNTRAALAFAQVSLSFKQKLGDRYGEAVALGTIGRVFVRQARYSEARQAFRDDLAIASELGDERGVGIMLNSLGEVSLLTQQIETAADYYRQNLASDRGPANRLHALLGLARVHLAGLNIDEASRVCEQMGCLLDQFPDFQSLRDAHAGLRGAIAWRRGDFQAGERLLGAAIESLSRQEYTLETLPSLYELRDLYQKQGSRSAAVRVMGRALDLLGACGAERAIEDAEAWLRTVDSPGLIRVALERHFPQWLVDQILSGRLSRPQTVRQEVAVLFCDLRDYTTLAEGLAPEQVVQLLNEWFAVATQEIQQQGGVVDKYIGDAIMAVFGVPEPCEDAAVRAVRAALGIRETLALFNLRRKALGGREISAGIGIDTGEVVVGFIGSHLQQSYAAIGTPTNTANRLEAATRNYPGCDLLISERTEEIQQRFGVAETAFVGYPKLKGRTQKVGVYRVLGPRSR